MLMAYVLSVVPVEYALIRAGLYSQAVEEYLYVIYFPLEAIRFVAPDQFEWLMTLESDAMESLFGSLPRRH
jgi:hypothetical protein